MASNTSLLDTNLNASPYFDDFDQTKQFYKVLFKPRTAVQTRELNQLQTILQDQISKFGHNIYKEGTIIEGCSPTYDNKYSFVKLKDVYANGSALTVGDLNTFVVVGQYGLNSVIVNTVNGLESKNPDLNTIYLKYLNTGTYSNGGSQKNYDPNELLSFYTAANTYQGGVYVANVASPTGYGYAFNITEGVIFKKGYFIYVTPQTTIVKKYDNVPDAVSIGFAADESIVTPNNDESLFDNAAGSPNYAAPGADRLKLSPTLITRSTESANTSTFFPIVDFKEGLPITARFDPQFNSIEKEVARRTYETNGNFVVNPFIVTTKLLANTANANYSTYFNAIIGRGLGYVEGHRVEFINNVNKAVRKGTDFDTQSSQNVSINFGYYALVQELSGNFESSSRIIQVELHNIPKTSITSKTWLSTGYSSSTKIGTAYIRGFSFDNGSQGDATGQFKIYMFNIQMNPGTNFADVESIIHYYGGALLGVADVVQTFDATSGSNVASIYNPAVNTMIFPVGQKAVKGDGFAREEFVYRKVSSSTVGTAGNTSIGIDTVSGSGSETFVYTDSLSTSQMNDFIVIPTSNGFSTNNAGNVQIYTTNNSILGTTTTFATTYKVGDIILTNGQSRTIKTISNNIFLTTDSVGNANASNLTHQKMFVKGSPIPFTVSRPNRTMNVSANTLYIYLGETCNSTFTVDIVNSVKRKNTTSIKKTVNENIFVKIDCSNNSGGKTGPWTLGVPDVYQLKGVYLDSSGNKTYSNTGTNYVNNFILDKGQRDSWYDIASINTLPAVMTELFNSNTVMLVQFSAFTYNTSQGKGFFDANSYPIDDTNPANTNAITTAEIPTYTTTSGRFLDLRDSIDFRPYASNTAVVTGTIASATINPINTLTFNYTPYLPAPDSIFKSDIQYYLSRTDRIAIDTNGNAVVFEGLPSATTPAAPIEHNGTMTLSLLKIPPYPSLTTEEAKLYKRYDNAIESQPSQNRRYTMKDIASFDKRIKNLEYYTSLSLLESSAASLQVRSTTTGQTRFQNGIFVEPFNGFDLSNTRHPKFYIAIDPSRTELRPAFVQVRSDFTFDSDLSTGVVKHGDLVMLPHSSNNVYIKQGYASKYRNCIEGNIFTWRGTILLTPTGSVQPDITTTPDVINNIDLAQNFVNLQNAWGTQWGNWETISKTYAATLISATSSSTEHVGSNPNGSDSVSYDSSVFVSGSGSVY
jgi:hypothetical protein